MKKKIKIEENKEEKEQQTKLYKKLINNNLSYKMFKAPIRLMNSNMHLKKNILPNKLIRLNSCKRLHSSNSIILKREKNISHPTNIENNHKISFNTYNITQTFGCQTTLQNCDLQTKSSCYKMGEKYNDNIEGSLNTSSFTACHNADNPIKIDENYFKSLSAYRHKSTQSCVSNYDSSNINFSNKFYPTIFTNPALKKNKLYTPFIKVNISEYNLHLNKSNSGIITVHNDISRLKNIINKKTTSNFNNKYNIRFKLEKNLPLKKKKVIDIFDKQKLKELYHSSLSSVAVNINKLNKFGINKINKIGIGKTYNFRNKEKSYLFNEKNDINYTCSKRLSFYSSSPNLSNKFGFNKNKSYTNFFV